jgi:cytochrome c oxidase subunit 2
MEIHRFEKVWIAAAMLLIIGFIGTVTYGALGAGIQMVNDDGGTIDPANFENNPTEYDPPGDNWNPPGGEWVPGQEGEHYRMYVLAYQFGFRIGEGDEIRIPADTKVTFYVTSQDVVHGFEVAGTNVNTMVIPGQVSKITTRFDEPGDYGVLCNEYCGANHHNMAIDMQVVPKEAFQGGN